MLLVVVPFRQLTPRLQVKDCTPFLIPELCPGAIDCHRFSARQPAKSQRAARVQGRRPRIGLPPPTGASKRLSSNAQIGTRCPSRLCETPPCFLSIRIGGQPIG